ncbi:type 1 glutamine amidotransferase domain-containing protein [Luteimonas sp. RIT-PG2_3]
MRMPSFVLRSWTLRLSAALLSCVLLAQAHAADRVLIVVSGEGRDQGRTRPGYEFDELSQAWLIFRDNGLDVDVASPQGGPVEADRYNPEEPFNAAFLADANAMDTLANTRALRDLDARDYAAIYIVGGKGAMFDLPKDAALRNLLARIHDQGGIVAAVCHGPAALADVRLGNGEWLVAGRAMTGFSNEEEALFGKTWAKEFPWLLEDALRERGARWQEAPLMMPKLVVDDRLITGQNPYSTTAVAEAVVRATGRVPVARAPWRDERTMALVQRRLEGDTGAAAILAEHKADYHVELIGILGFYQLKAATTAEQIGDALSVMELAAPYMEAPELKLARAEAHHRLGDNRRAREILAALLEAKPEMTEARQLLQQIDG